MTYWRLSVGAIMGPWRISEEQTIAYSIWNFPTMGGGLKTEAVSYRLMSAQEERGDLSTCWMDFFLNNVTMLYGWHLHLAEARSLMHSASIYTWPYQAFFLSRHKWVCLCSACLRWTDMAGINQIWL